ncbi:MAG: hypothetical protein RLY86_1750 [Pseudomonadota bacterium]|jgi:hypothetical protein
MIGVLAKPYAADAGDRAEARPIAGLATIPCTVEIENSAESLHAHVDLHGVEPGPGDTVIVYGAPQGIDFGRSARFDCRAQIIRAGWLERQWVYLTAYLGLTELYEVSFSDGSV